MPVTIDQIVPWGRTLDEYVSMFGLTATEMELSILGCGDGPASFNSEMTQLGNRVMSVDPLYAFTRKQITDRIDATYDTIVGQLQQNDAGFVWDRFGDPLGLGRHRMGAMQTFLDDYEKGQAAGRYVQGNLPDLHFADGTFGLALCSHLLFLYSEQLSYDFHVGSICELCRVATEVRIYPLLDMNCQRSVHVDPIQNELRAAGYAVTETPVPYEFQQGATHMLKIRNPAETASPDAAMHPIPSIATGHLPSATGQEKTQ